MDGEAAAKARASGRPHPSPGSPSRERDGVAQGRKGLEEPAQPACGRPQRA